MNPFSVVSHIQSNLPSLPTALLQRRKSAVVNVVVHSSPLTKTTPSTTTTTTTTTTRTHPLPPHAPTSTTTTTIVEEHKEEQELTEQAPAAIVASVPNKPRNNPQAIIGNFDGATEAEIKLATVDLSTDLGSKNLNRHSIHIMQVSTPPVVAEEKNLQRIALRRHTSFPTPNTVQSSHANDSNGLPERAASLDGYDRAKILKSSPSDAVQATTMISQPRPSHLRHTRSSSLPHSLGAPAQSPRSPATVPTPHAPASLLSNIPPVDSSMVDSDDESEEDSEDSVEDSEEDSEEDGAEEHPEDQDQSSQPRSQFGSASDPNAAAAAPVLAASTLGKEAVIVTPPASPSLNAAATASKAPITVPVSTPAPIVVAPAPLSPPTSSPPSPSPRKTTSTSSTPAPIMVVSHQNSPSIPPSSPIHSVTYVSPTTSSTTTTSKTTTTTTTTTTATVSPSAAPVPSPVSIATPSTPSTPSTPPSAPAPVTTAATATPPASSPSTASSFLSAWQGRSRAMIPTIPRPSPLMPFRAARKVVSSVTTAGSGLLPTKEQLNSIPVAGRILSHPVMDSTLSYIAEKASERGIDLHALTGGIDPKKLIRPEDVPYRKLNKTMIHQAMTLSVLAVQKEELSKAMDDEDGDDAFELYLAAVNTLLHSLPFETCDPLRREAFETQLRSFLDDQLCQKDDGYLSETGSTSKRLRRRRRRRHRQHHDQATSLIHQHTQETTAEPTTSQGHQRRQQIRQKNLQREQRIKQQQLMMRQQALEKQQQQEQKEKRRQEKKIAAAMAAAAASQKQQPGKASAPAQQDRSAAKKSSKRSSHSRRRQAAQYAQHPHEVYDDHSNNNGGGLGDTIISTAVHSAIRLKQSPIPDVVKSCLRTSKTIFNKVDERFHLQDKAWELSKNSIEKAIELDEQYAIHEVVTETVFATLTGLVKAGIAYKESPSYAAVRAAASENGKIAAAPPVQVLESASLSPRSLHPQGAQPSSKRSSKSKKAAAALKEKEKAAAAAAAAATANSSITSRWIRRPQSVVVESEGSSDSEKDSDDSDSDSDSDSEAEQSKTKKTYKNKLVSSSASSSSSAFSSGSSSCSSTAGSGAENDSDSDNETVELNHETLRPSATSRSGFSHSDTSKLPPPPPYSEQVREKIDMFMALKGAASLLVGSL